MRRGDSEFHPFWLGLPLVAAIVLVQAISRGFVAFDTSLLPDEGYYTLWSFHPSTGYLDHPPMIAWLIALGRLVVGENSLGVRLLAVIAPVIISLALYRTGTLLTDRASALLAVLWYNLSLGVALSLLATPDVPSTLFWMLTAWAVAEFIAGRNANWWLLVGLFAGLGVLGKYTNLFLGAGIVLLILSGRARWQWLKLWQVWAGGVIALLVAAPNLIWNAQNGWATFVKQGGRIASDPAGRRHRCQLS
jgi:4-amino-4-deoxy-L-arabinose transferase-like glycosyltransferase